MNRKFDTLISQILTSEADTLDWEKALFLNDILNANKIDKKYIYIPLMEIIAKGTLKVKMNSIDLVDSFFKNGTVESQKSLQINVPIIFPIDNFCNELTVHMRFCKAVHSWAYICKNNKC